MAQHDTTDIGELVRKAESDYTSGETTISKYVQFSQHENIERIEAYLNSKHTSGDTDSQDRDKPFFNIVTAAVNIWFRATDIDRKDIKVKAGKTTQKIAAYAGTLLLQDWMRRNKFGVFLNDWGRSLARYGSSVLKFVEKDGKLIPAVIPWNRLITDTVDFENNPVIEVLWLTPAQLMQNKSYDKELVDELLDAIESRETTDKQNKDNKADYIKLYEVHGELPLSYITGKKKDEQTYVQQMQVISFVAKKKEGKFDDFTLYKGREARNPYMITHLIKEDGRSQSIGAVENLFEAQWMTNHTMKSMKDYLDIASKLIMQTADGNFVGQNVLSAIENGDILVHAVNSPLTTVNTAKPDITQLQAFGQQWQALGKEINGISDAMLGDVKAGAAWRQTQAILQESHSLFELMTENKGLHIIDMCTDYVIPHLKKQMDTSDELGVILDSAGIAEFDSMYVPNEAIRRANRHIKQTILSGEVAQQPDLASIEGDIKQEQNGNQRFIKPSDIDDKTWKEALGDIEWEMEIDVTGEATDKMAVMQTLDNVFKTLVSMNGQPMTDEQRIVFNQILDETGAISSLQLANVRPPKPQPQPQPPATNQPQIASPTQPVAA